MTKKSLEDVLAEHGIDITPDFTIGKIRNGSQWLFCYEIELDGKKVQYAHFGDFKTGVEGAWCGDEAEETPERKKRRRAKEKEVDRERAEMQRTQWEESKLEAHRFLREECTTRSGPTPYLQKKGLSELFGASVHINDHGSHVLVVPMRDAQGVVWNYQRIYPEKLSKGDKFFLEGAKIEGCFFAFGEEKDPSLILIAEGFATAASIFLAFNKSPLVVAAFNAGNLLSVSKALREKYPQTKIILCADNDQFTVINGQHVNVGLTKARNAAAEIGASVVWPRFKDAY